MGCPRATGAAAGPSFAFYRDSYGGSLDAESFSEAMPAAERCVRELVGGVADDPHRDSARSGRVFVDAVNSRGAFEVRAGSRAVLGSLPGMLVLRCRRCSVVRGQDF